MKIILYNNNNHNWKISRCFDEKKMGMTGTFYCYLDCQCESARGLRSGDHVPTSVDYEVVAYRCVKVV